MVETISDSVEVTRMDAYSRDFDENKFVSEKIKERNKIYYSFLYEIIEAKVAHMIEGLNTGFDVLRTYYIEITVRKKDEDEIYRECFDYFISR